MSFNVWLFEFINIIGMLYSFLYYFKIMFNSILINKCDRKQDESLIRLSDHTTLMINVTVKELIISYREVEMLNLRDFFT